MKATKKLLGKAVRYQKLHNDLDTEVRQFMSTATPMEDDAFWAAVDYFAQQIAGRRMIGSPTPIVDATHNLLLRLSRPEDPPLEGWYRAAAFLKKYLMVEARLYEKCWHMPGVDKGDDSYGDWIELLPLLGRSGVEAIFAGKIASYLDVEKDLKVTRPDLVEFIQDGEFYLTMTMEEEFTKRFVAVAMRMDREAHEEDLA